MTLPIVLVLEDCKYRMEWLTSALKGKAHVRWTWRVQDFLRLLDEHRDSVAAIVLDHDIPPPEPDDEELISLQNNLNDEDGKCGYDAVLEMPAVPIPVLVWSVNGPGSERMMRALREKGMRAERMPHLQVYYDRMESYLCQAIESHGKGQS